MRQFLVLILAACWEITTAAAGSVSDAAKAGNDARIAQVIDTGGEVHKRGPQGDTLLHWAAFDGREDVVAQLIALGADVNAVVDNGNTPLHQAAYRGHTDVVELLIAHGADVNPRTLEGVTPLDWAQRNGHGAAARVLIAHGARKGTAPENNSALAGHQTDDDSRRDQLPDRVLFAALSYLPSLNRMPRRASDVPETELPVAEQTERPQQMAGFRVQLAAMRSEVRAREMWQQYLTRHRAILESLQLTVELARVNGVSFYRVQGGPLTKAAARSTCDALTRANQECLVVSVSGLASR